MDTGAACPCQGKGLSFAKVLMAFAVGADGSCHRRPTWQGQTGQGAVFLTTKNTKNHQGCTKAANRLAVSKPVFVDVVLAFSSCNIGNPWRFPLLELNALSNRVIGPAIDVHRAIGPGLLESV